MRTYKEKINETCRAAFALILAFAIIMSLAAVKPAYAAEDSSKGPAATIIDNYDTYHGKNATKIPVLAYHNVVSDKAKARNGSSIVISKSDFRKQMKYLHDRGYRTINCEELYLWRKGKIKLPPKSVLITFDNGLSGVYSNALPVLKKYGMKGSCFIIGSCMEKGGKQYISRKQMKKIRKSYPDIEFQSHTYDLHRTIPEKGSYKKVLADAKKMKKLLDPEYVAYPYGTHTKGMVKAYKKMGIKMALAYGNDGYATKDQSLFNMKRISVNGNASFSSFKKWFR